MEDVVPLIPFSTVFLDHQPSMCRNYFHGHLLLREVAVYATRSPLCHVIIVSEFAYYLAFFGVLQHLGHPFPELTDLHRQVEASRKHLSGPRRYRGALSLRISHMDPHPPQPDELVASAAENEYVSRRKALHELLRQLPQSRTCLAVNAVIGILRYRSRVQEVYHPRTPLFPEGVFIRVVPYLRIELLAPSGEIVYHREKIRFFEGVERIGAPYEFECIVHVPPLLQAHPDYGLGKDIQGVCGYVHPVQKSFVCALHKHRTLH